MFNPLLPVIGKGIGQAIGLLYCWAKDWFDARWVRRQLGAPLPTIPTIFYDKAFIGNLKTDVKWERKA